MPLFGRSERKPEKKERTTRARTPEPPQPAAPEEERFGLFELWPNTPLGETTKVPTVLDIVAVHGLGGHPYKTWTEGQNLWLRDFLPKVVPDARVFTFGYNSAVAFGGTASKVDDFATTLLERLLQKRKQYRDHVRPVIFVCHSLGGIVFKRALIMAHAHETRYGTLKTAIKSVMFMGTPHRGADIANWSRLVKQIAKVPGLSDIRTDLLDDLRPKSELLMTISSDFVERAAALTIFSIYERNFLPHWGDLVVDKDSAVLNLINETRMPVNADHRTMCKFLTSSSEAYDTVYSCLGELIDKAKGEDDSWLSKTRADFMKSLLRFDHRNILNQVPKPYIGTCQWITQDPEFRRWRQARSSSDLGAPDLCRVFFIYGIPGVGKTVMSRYILTYLRALKVSHQDPPVVVYFFCDDKDPKRRTSLNLLRSLLFQILIYDKSLLRFISEEAMEAHLEKLRAHSMGSDEQQDLWDALSTVIQRSRAPQFWMVIDALDELDPASRKDAARQIMRILEKDTVGRLKVLFTDRLESQYDFPNPAVVELGASESQADVRSYIRQKVVELSEEVMIESKYKNAIEDEIALMANGTFLHATLAFANFTRGVTDWTPRVIKTRLKDLQRLPASLEAYYAGLLRHIPTDFHRKARRAFIWVLGSTSRAPLTIRELHHAVSVNESQQSWSDLQEDLGYNFESTFQAACGYLLKVDEWGYVAFAHQTVKELFVNKNQSVREIDENVLSRYRISPSDVDADIVQTCLTLLRFKDFGKENVESSLVSQKTMHLEGSRENEGPIFKFTNSYPLLSYAIRYWNHFDNVANEVRVAKALELFVQSFQGNYFRLAAGPWTQSSRRAVPGASGLLPRELPALHYCIQSGDFPTTVLGLVENGADFNQMDDDGLTPLHWACARINKGTVAALLSVTRLNINKGLPGKSRPIHTALEWLSSSRGMDVPVEVPFTILKDTRTDINVPGVFSRTPLHICLLYGGKYEPVSNFLLDFEDIDLNAEDDDGGSPFVKAFNRPEHENIVLKMLKNPAVRIDNRAKNARADPLSMAGLWDWESVEEELIHRDVDQVFAFGNDGFNYLTRYAFLGRKAKVLRLLGLLKDHGNRLRESVGEGSDVVESPWSHAEMLSETWEHRHHGTNLMPPGSDINDNHRMFHHLLHLCAQQDWEDTAMILEKDFDIHGLPNGDHVGRTMLHWAVEQSWSYALKNFSDKPKHWLDHQDRDGMTALHLACQLQNRRIAEHLVDSGANYLLKDKLGKTPVHLAAEIGCRSIIRLFTDEPTREYGRDKEGRSLLHYLVMWQPGSLVEDFIRSKRPIVDVLDKTRRTPLSYAALYNNDEAMEVLHNHKAKINILDSNASTPLHQALKGSAQSAQLLIDWGAKLTTLDGFHQTCLQLAIRSQRSDTISLMLSYVTEDKDHGQGWVAGTQAAKSMIRNRDVHGKTALHRLCSAHDFDRDYTSKESVFTFVHMLIKYGGNVDAQDNFGYTPAHIAAIGNNFPAMDALLDADPDLCLLDQHRCTPMDWALAQGQTKMADLMREVGGVETPNYMEKLGAYQRETVQKGEGKVYDMSIWALVPTAVDYRTGRRYIEAWGVEPEKGRENTRRSY